MDVKLYAVGSVHDLFCTKQIKNALITPQIHSHMKERRAEIA